MRRVGKAVGRIVAALTLFELAILIVFITILIVTVIGPWIAPYPTETANPPQHLLSPRPSHWLGTDQNGMDILSRILAAPRTDVLVAVVATALSVGIGSALGALAGFFEGTRQKLASIMSEGMLRVLDVIQAFPVFIFAMVLVAIRGARVENVIAAVAFVNMPVFLRLVRSEILSLRERPYAEAARAVGNSDMGVVFRHLLPNALPVVVVQTSVTVGFAILLTAGLSFVGAGIRPPQPELGSMISTGSQYMITGQWWASLFPGIALGIIVFAFAMVGESIGRIWQHGTGAVEIPGQIAPTPTGTPMAEGVVPALAPDVDVRPGAS
jgi:peptide/nickel transport system permease protein